MQDPEVMISSRGGQLKRIESMYGIPENAVILDDQKVLSMQWKMVSQWKPRREMWPFIYGPAMLGGFAAFGGIMCNSHFRAKFNLGRFGRTPTFLAAAIVPASLAALTHSTWVSNFLLLGRFDCLICAQIRSGSIQAALGAIYPLLLTPPMAIVIARKNWTYPIPKISQHKEVVEMLYNTAYPFKYVFAGLLVMQFFMGAGLVRQEYKVFVNKLSAGMLPMPDEMDSS